MHVSTFDSEVIGVDNPSDSPILVNLDEFVHVEEVHGLEPDTSMDGPIGLGAESAHHRLEAGLRFDTNRKADGGYVLLPVFLDDQHTARVSAATGGRAA